MCRVLSGMGRKWGARSASPSPLPAHPCVVSSRTEASSWVTTLWSAFQEAVFDKNTGKVVLKTFSLYRKLLSLSRDGHEEGEAWGARGTLGTPGWTEGSGHPCGGGDRGRVQGGHTH